MTDDDPWTPEVDAAHDEYMHPDEYDIEGETR